MNSMTATQMKDFGEALSEAADMMASLKEDLQTMMRVMNLCSHPSDAVYLNNWNGVIQCHKCGQRALTEFNVIRERNIWPDTLDTLG